MLVSMPALGLQVHSSLLLLATAADHFGQNGYHIIMAIKFCNDCHAFDTQHQGLATVVLCLANSSLTKYWIEMVMPAARPPA